MDVETVANNCCELAMLRFIATGNLRPRGNRDTKGLNFALSVLVGYQAPPDVSLIAFMIPLPALSIHNAGLLAQSIFAKLQLAGAIL